MPKPFIGTKHADDHLGPERIMVGKAGDDTLTSTKQGSIFLFGGKGGDILSAQYSSSSFVFGGPSNDVLLGGDGRDVLRGGKGGDLLLGEGGDDKLFGGRGKDTIMQSDGNDLMHGGRGADTFIFNLQFNGIPTIDDFKSGRDTMILDVNSETVDIAYADGNLLVNGAVICKVAGFDVADLIIV